MRIARIPVAGHMDFAGQDRDGAWIPVSTLGVDAPDTPALIASARTVQARLAEGLGEPVSGEVTLKCPVVNPTKVIAVGLNYMDHIRETDAEVPERPVLFAKFPNTLNGPYDDVIVNPELTEQGDYEVELAVIVGRQTRDVDEENALDSVFGYAIANDVSARDWQQKENYPDRSKGFDTFCPVGPWITTSEAVSDPQDLALRSLVNGEVRQESNTKEMIFPVARLVSYLSTTMTLNPGDLIITGTPHGVGFVMEPPRFLGDGDVVRCEIAGLGHIENRIVAP